MYVCKYVCMHMCVHACLRACVCMYVCKYVCRYGCVRSTDGLEKSIRPILLCLSSFVLYEMNGRTRIKKSSFSAAIKYVFFVITIYHFLYIFGAFLSLCFTRWRDCLINSSSSTFICCKHISYKILIVHPSEKTINI